MGTAFWGLILFLLLCALAVWGFIKLADALGWLADKSNERDRRRAQQNRDRQPKL